MTDFVLDDETTSGIASKFKLEEVVEDNSELTDEQKQELEEAERQKQLAEEQEKAEKDKGKPKGGNEDDDDEKNLTAIKFLFKTEGITEDDEIFKDFDLEDDSVENIKKFYDLKAERVKESAIEELLSSDADLKELALHKAQGGTLESFKAIKQAENYPTEIDEDDDETLEKVFTLHHKELGFSDKKIKTLLEAAKDDDELKTEVKNILSERKEQAAKEAKARFEAEKTQRDNEIKQVQKVNAELDEMIVKKGIIDERIIIPEKQRTEFRKYLNSEERDKKWENLSTSQLALIDYLIFNNFELKGIEKPKPKQAIVVKRPVIAGGSGGDENEMSYSELIGKLKGRNS